MKGYVLSLAAQRDLHDIWDYSAEAWSRCERLGAGRARGRSVGDVRPGYFKLAVQSHFLFYRVLEGDIVDIVRILHQSMDIDQTRP
jgi:toxin ParE1/3/4